MWRYLVPACALLACSADGVAGGRGSQGDGSSAVQAAVGACQQRNLTLPCSCGDSPGRQVCRDGAWAACECLARTDGGAGPLAGPGADLAGNQRADITFVWAHTPATSGGGECLPGRYEGNFQGLYYSYIATLSGAMGLGVPIANLEPPNAPSGFHFTVEPAQGGETIQRVKGEMTGTADLTFPFTAQIEGELDCAASTFTARLLAGRYSVLTDGLLPQTFEGVMSGHYDKRTHTFVDGSWDVMETSASPPGTLAPTEPRDFARDGYGGFGDWAAGLSTDLNDPAVTPCPANYTCAGGPLGPNKLLCGGLLGVPACISDADCASLFPGEMVPCLKASAFSLCLRECKP